MILQNKIMTNIEINSLSDLPKLKLLMENSNIKINKSQIARNLDRDVRTVTKYLYGYEKPNYRKRKTYLDSFKSIIDDLLSSKTQIFYYIRNLYNYLKDNHNLNVPEPTFRHFINRNIEYKEYFKKDKKSNAINTPVLRFETAKGKQAQLDWKEKIKFTLKDTNEEIEVNVFVLILSYSRNRIYRLSIKKTQDVLFHFLTEAFETFGGVPDEILTDNMSTVMDDARTLCFEGKINDKFYEFSKDFGFKVKPCMAASPQTKSKVESPMRVLDEIYAYNGTLDYIELNQLIEKLNNKYNYRINDGTGKIPAYEFQKEKGFLNPLPNESIRNHYRIKTFDAKVNSSSLISFKGNCYSVPPELLGKTVQFQIIDSNIYIYHNKSLIAMHKISDSKMNIEFDHYKKIVSLNFPNMNVDEIEEFAKNNLKMIGELYNE